VRVYARRAEQGAAATRYVTENLPMVVKDRGSGEVGVATFAGPIPEALDGLRRRATVTDVTPELTYRRPQRRKAHRNTPNQMCCNDPLKLRPPKIALRTRSTCRVVNTAVPPGTFALSRRLEDGGAVPLAQ